MFYHRFQHVPMLAATSGPLGNHSYRYNLLHGFRFVNTVPSLTALLPMKPYQLAVSTALNSLRLSIRTLSIVTGKGFRFLKNGPRVQV